MKTLISESHNTATISALHRCTVVGNPGGVPWVFLVNSFEGGTWGCEKIRGRGRFYCIFMWKFSKIFIGGT